MNEVTSLYDAEKDSRKQMPSTSSLGWNTRRLLRLALEWIWRSGKLGGGKEIHQPGEIIGLLLCSTINILRGLSLVALVALMAACASSDSRLGSDAEDRSNANPAVYGADAFTYRKQQKIRPHTTEDFYYKHCDPTGDQAFTSKTSYWCSEP